MVIPGHGRLCDIGRRRVLPRHGDDHPRPRAGHGQEGDDARAGEGGEADRRLRRALRRDERSWTTDMFIEAVYKTLPREERPPARGDSQRPKRGGTEVKSPIARRGDRRVRGRSRRSRCSRSAAAAARRRRARRRASSRSHRLLGVARHRGLALADGHAAEGRLPERSAQRRGTTGRGRLGSGEGRSGRRAVQGVRRGGIMRMPARLHITWEDDNTLKIETDAGQQTRRFIFGPVPPRRWRRPRRPMRAFKVCPSRLGICRRARSARGRRRSRPAASEGGDDWHASGLPAAQWRSLQRQCRCHGIFEPGRRNRMATPICSSRLSSKTRSI